MDSQLIDPLFQFARTQPATTCVFEAGQQKEWILDSMRLHGGNFIFKSSFYLLRREGAAKIFRYLGISPEAHRQGQIIFRPASEGDSRS